MGRINSFFLLVTHSQQHGLSQTLDRYPYEQHLPYCWEISVWFWILILDRDIYTFYSIKNWKCWIPWYSF